MTSLSRIAKKLLASALEAVAPDKLVKNALQRRGDILIVDEKQYLLSKNVYVVGFGKAVLGMTLGVQDILKDHIVRGIISVPYGTAKQFSKQYQSVNENIKVMEGARNNVPDGESVKNADTIKKLIQAISIEDILVVLTSGGGSALLPAPPKGVGLTNKLATIKLVARAGGTIQQLNTIRKHLSLLKGGKLAMLCPSKNIISLIISDIVNDPLDLIASAPTVFDTSTAKDCIHIFRSLSIIHKVPQVILDYLQTQMDIETNNADSKRDCLTEQCHNSLVGSNRILVNDVALKAREFGYKPFVVTTSLEGDATEIGYIFAELVSSILLHEPKSKIAEYLSRLNSKFIPDQLFTDLECGLKLCLITAGETTVHVTGNGRGGRNQQLVLSALIRMRDKVTKNSGLSFLNMCLLSAGTDGQDGPTDAAGAFCDGNILDYIIKSDVNLDEYLRNNASYDFFSPCLSGEYLLRPGLTGTNVMDIQLLMIDLSTY